MTKRYTLPTVTVDGQELSIVIAANDAKLREWLRDVRCHRLVVPSFSFYWEQDPCAYVFYRIGSFYVAHRMDGIYIKMNLCYEDYRDVLYPLDDLYSMLFNKRERPSLGWCITVTVQ